MPHQDNDKLHVEFRTCDLEDLVAHLRGQQIYFRHCLYGAESSIRPSHHDWQNFWRSIDEIDVWNWAPDYSNCQVLDGFSWSIELTHGSKSVRSEGSNGYPGQPIDEPEPSETFCRFRAALHRLIFGAADSYGTQP